MLLLFACVLAVLNNHRNEDCFVPRVGLLQKVLRKYNMRAAVGKGMGACGFGLCEKP